MTADNILFPQVIGWCYQQKYHPTKRCKKAEREVLAYLIMVAVVGPQFGIIFSAG